MAANDGAPGADGIRIEDIGSTPGGIEWFLDELHETLKRKRYRPQAVRLKMISRADGGPRLLGTQRFRVG